MASPLDTLESSFLPGDEAYVSGALPSITGDVTHPAEFIKVPGGKKGSSAVLDATNSADILAKMQAFLDERNSPMNKFMGGIQDVLANSVPDVHGEGSAALLARQKQKAEENKSAQEMQMQIAEFKAAQAKQKAYTDMLAKLYPDSALAKPETANLNVTGGAPGAPVGPGTTPNAAQVVSTSGGQAFSFKSLPPEIQSSALAQPDHASFQKVIDTWAEKHAEKAQDLSNTLTTQQQKFGFDKQLEPIKFENSAAANEQKVYFLNGKEVMMTPLEYARSKNIPVQTAIDQGKPAKVDAAPVAETSAAFKGGSPTLASLQYGVMGNESGFGSADTSKPGIQGAMGPMQVTGDTWKTFQDRGVIPKNFDINNKTQNQLGGNAILAYYYDKYKGDPDKVLAAYHGGEGAINKDGTINLNRKDALGTSIGQYIQSAKQKAGLTDESKGVTSVADASDYGVYKQEQERQKQFNTAYSQGEAKDSLARRNSTIASYQNADTNIANADYLTNLVNNNSAGFGVLSHATILSALGKMIEGGTTSSVTGQIHSPAFEQAIRQAAPGIEESDVIAVQKAAQKFAELQLNAAKVLLAGQGAVSDAERMLIAQRTGSPANSPAAVRAILKWGRLGAEYDKEMGAAFNNWEKTHRHQDFRDFELNSPEYSKLKDKFRTKIDALAKSEGNYRAPDSKTNPADIKPPPGYDPNWRSRKIVSGE